MAPTTWELDPTDPWSEKYIQAWEKEVTFTPDPDVLPLEVVSREEWGALPPLEEGKAMVYPIQAISFIHTQTEECHTKEECMAYMKKHQKVDMEDKEIPDIQYNFYIGGDLKIYEGRGWKVQADKDDISIDTEDKSVDIAYIGDFRDKEMSKELIDVGVSIAKYGRKMEYLHLNYNINTFWEDHIYELRVKWKKNPLDDPLPSSESEDDPEDFTTEQEQGLLPRTI